MARTFLIIGSNLGNRLNLLEQASKKIHDDVGLILNQSSIYETEPWGFDHPTKFLNQVLEIETTMDPVNLLVSLQEIEKMYGRTRRSEGYCARTLDIDILFYDSIIFTSENLTIPHPGITERKFVLIPLCELTPHFQHPVLKKSVDQLLTLCEDNSEVVLFKKPPGNIQIGKSG